MCKTKNTLQDRTALLRAHASSNRHCEVQNPPSPSNILENLPSISLCQEHLFPRQILELGTACQHNKERDSTLNGNEGFQPLHIYMINIPEVRTGIKGLNFEQSPHFTNCESGRDSSVGIVTATGWTVRGSNPDGGEIFRTRPERPWGQPNLLYNKYRVIPGGKAAGA